MSDDDEIRAVIEGYARHADAGETEAFAGLFLPDAVLRTTADGTVRSHYAGRDEIAAIPGKLTAAYDRTDHRVGRGSIAVEGSGATAIATTACEAHHVLGDVDRVMSIRYEDTFGRDGDGRWRFVSREVHVLATDERPA